MKIRREFYPVGQGAFYSETFSEYDTKSPSSTYTIVYDCGSVSLDQKELLGVIENSFPEGHKIDILFISHFHADHINGIEMLAKRCVISKVVIPFVDDITKVLYKISNRYEYDIMAIIDGIDTIMPDDTTIITIEPIDRPQTVGGFLSGTAVNPATITGSTTLSSGVMFKPFSHIDWFLIPFNYKHNYTLKKLENSLTTVGLTLGDIDTAEKIVGNKNKLVKMYKTFSRNINNQSMLLCSLYHTSENTNNTNNINLIGTVGCLYTGDISLKTKKIFNSIQTNLGKLIDGIETLQIPHHGAKSNFSASILKNNINKAVISHGKKNTYGHPSSDVVNDIKNSGKECICITEYSPVYTETNTLPRSFREISKKNISLEEGDKPSSSAPEGSGQTLAKFKFFDAFLKKQNK